MSSVAEGKRPQTPYTPAARATLLDDESALTDKLVDALEAIFLKYAVASSTSKAKGKGKVCRSTGNDCTRCSSHMQSGDSDSGVDGKVLDSAGLERFGVDTNGSPMPDDQVCLSPSLDLSQAADRWYGQIEELRNFLDCDEEQNLTFKGFIQVRSNEPPCACGSMS